MKTTLRIIAASLLLAPLTPALDLVPFNSTWDFMHPTIGDPAVSDTDFDSTWMLGETGFLENYNGPDFGSVPTVGGPPVNSGTGPAPIGYGDLDAFAAGLSTSLTTPESGSRRTAYFRHNFNVAAEVENLQLEILADDGAVVYIDGVELARLNLPFIDTYNATTLANGDEGGTAFFQGGIGGLAVGDHTIAVSVHQTSTTSSDLGFDLRLSDDGFPNPPIGRVTLGGEPTRELFAAGDLMGWTPNGTSSVSVTAGIDATLRSESVDISEAGDVSFSVTLTAEEVSGGSNFEDTDTLNAYLEVTDGIGGMTTISLLPYGFDTDGSGALNGEEFAPGVAVTFAAQFVENVAARIPASAASFVFVVESNANSASETFIVTNAIVEDAVSPAPVLGTVEFDPVADIPVMFGPAPWTVTAPGEFTLNVGFIATIISEDIDLTGAPPTTAQLTLNARETSTGSNFEAGDFFQAYVEVANAAGEGRVIQLVNGDPDTNGSGLIAAEEFAPGVDFSVEVDVTYALAVNLPRDAVKARIVVLASNNSFSEFYTISEIKLAPTPPVFQFTEILESAGEVDLTWESEAGAVYDLQFSPDMSEGSWATVETVTATGPTTSGGHAANAPSGFYRVIRKP